MIARQTNSQSFKIRINFVSKIFWFKVTGFFLLIRQLTCFKDSLLEEREEKEGDSSIFSFCTLIGAPFCCQCIMLMFFILVL